MLQGKLRINGLISAFMLFLISLIICVYYTYSTIRSDVINTLDNRLINAATSVKYILGDDYHSKINKTQTISFATYESKSKQLSELAQALDIAYVYSMVLINGKVHFSASSYTQEDQNSGKVTQFLDLYPILVPFYLLSLFLKYRVINGATLKLFLSRILIKMALHI